MRNELLYVGANNKLVDMDDSTNITLKYKKREFEIRINIFHL